MTTKNIWVAAGDGDLDRVKELIEQKSFSPNAPDPNSYTPMHAAASYGHVQILEYLLSRGGNVNVTDNDGDTPLYTVENVQTARFLVENGAIVARQNLEGVSPVDHLTEEFPDVAEYLRSTLGETLRTTQQSTTLEIPSQHSQNAASEELTRVLMSAVQDIIERAETEGRDPEDELRTVVGRTVLEGVFTGYEMTTLDKNNDSDTQSPSKRSRMDDDDRSN